MKRLLALLLIVAPLAAAEPMLFIYFKEPANMGAFYAISEDGLHWKALNGGRPWIGIEHANELIRDPFITRGPDHEFHMVWTWGWRGTSIGYAHSPDLVHWSEQREVPIMANVPGTKNTWAPEIYWDAAKSQWLIIFSSTVDGKHDGNRIYGARTKDFREVGKPGIFLHGLYEVQIFDSYGYSGPLAVGDCGGIYELPDGVGGSPPLRNAARPPGEWQSLHIWFQAPKVDAASGRVIGRAKVLRVMLNGVLVQDNVAIGGPTTSHMNLSEAPKNPVMLQGDHGPVAFRNIYIREFE